MNVDDTLIKQNILKIKLKKNSFYKFLTRQSDFFVYCYFYTINL